MMPNSPKAQWVKYGDTEFLFWGHLKVGEVAQSGDGWTAYFRKFDRDRGAFVSLRSFPAPDIARKEVEAALATEAVSALELPSAGRCKGET